MQNPLSHLFAYIVTSASSPSFLSGKPWLQEKSQSLAQQNGMGYFLCHVCFHRTKAAKSPKVISGNLQHITTLLGLCHTSTLSSQSGSRLGAVQAAGSTPSSLPPCLLLPTWTEADRELP